MGTALRGLVIAAAALFMVTLTAAFFLAPMCDRRIGDETDFPLFVIAGQTICGANTLFSGP